MGQSVDITPNYLNAIGTSQAQFHDKHSLGRDDGIRRGVGGRGEDGV